MNEAVLVGIAVLDLVCVMAAWRLGVVWLTMTIFVNLRLVATFGPVLVPVFGLLTNAGNVFYASAIFAIMLLLEQGSRREAWDAMLVGASGSVLFFLLGSLSVLLSSAPATAAFSADLFHVAQVTPHIAVASTCAFIVATALIILFYKEWREPQEMSGWIWRAASIIAAGQFVDSAIFFSLAFYGQVATASEFEIMALGFVLKTALGLATLPLLYVAHRAEKDPYIVLISA